ncbi:hypothetical protein V8B97DRAFT_2112134 [Scleroderma yunnanense]
MVKVHDSVDQDGSGIKPEKWLSRWGSDEIVGVYGGQSVRCMFDKRDHFGHLDIFMEPADWNEVPEKPFLITQLEVQSAMDESDIHQNLTYGQNHQLYNQGIDDSESGEPAADSSEIAFKDAGEATGEVVCQVDEIVPSASDESSDDSTVFEIVRSTTCCIMLAFIRLVGEWVKLHVDPYY